MAREAGKVTGKVARRTGRREPAAEARPIDVRFTDVRPMEMRPVKRDIATPRRAGGSTVGVLLMAATLAAPLLLTASVARAQITGADTSGPLFHGSKAKGSAPPPPSALPGARASKTVAPAAPDATGMDPTAALFDAINRDDVAAARDALSRGAALQADNVLGMTPLQLSIDLGRNDITFLLLSMGAGNAAASGEGGPPHGGAPAVGTAGGHGVLARRMGAPAGTPARTHPVRAPVVARVAAPMPVADRFAGNGGTPVPSAGFLGFDPTR